jgi:hypothetical protein
MIRSSPCGNEKATIRTATGVSVSQPLIRVIRQTLGYSRKKSPSSVRAIFHRNRKFYRDPRTPRSLCTTGTSVCVLLQSISVFCNREQLHADIDLDQKHPRDVLDSTQLSLCCPMHHFPVNAHASRYVTHFNATLARLRCGVALDWGIVQPSTSGKRVAVRCRLQRKPGYRGSSRR